MAITLNGHEYSLEGFLGTNGYGYIADHPDTGLPMFPDSIFTDLLAVLAGAATILEGGLAPGAAGAVAYSDGSQWVRSATPTLTSLTATTVTATNLVGGGGGITALNAGNLGSGTIPDARFPATLPALSGANLTNLSAGALTSGTVADGRLSSNVALKNTSNTFADEMIINDDLTISGDFIGTDLTAMGALRTNKITPRSESLIVVRNYADTEDNFTIFNGGSWGSRGFGTVPRLNIEGDANFGHLALTEMGSPPSATPDSVSIYVWTDGIDLFFKTNTDTYRLNKTTV